MNEQEMIPPCPRCKGTEFFPIPDSLAIACKECGFVWVGHGPDDFKPGATIGQWLEDVYGIPNEMDKQWTPADATAPPRRDRCDE